MNDTELTTSLHSLGLTAENGRAVVLLPLIEVAWADGRIQAAERRLIGQIASRFDIRPGDAWLARWLKRRPSKKTFLAARTVLLTLMNRQGRGGEPIATVDQLLDMCMWVAEAAGGVFGMAFTVERSERDCIEQIALSLSLGPSLPEAVVDAYQVARRRCEFAEAPTAHRRRGPRYGILDQTTHHLDVGASPTLREIPAFSMLPGRLQPALVVVEQTAPSQPHSLAEVTDPFDQAMFLREEGQTPLAPHVARVAVGLRSRPPEPSFLPVPRSGEVPEAAPSFEPRGAPTPTAVPLSYGESPPQPVVRKAQPAPTFDPIDPPGDPAFGVDQGVHRPVISPLGTPPERSGRSPEEDPTLPFFDNINVGTYALEPDDR